MLIRICGLAAVLALAGAGDAMAKTFWSATAASCLVAAEPGKTTQLKSNLASVEFQSAVGTMALNCPIPRFEDSAGFAWNMRLTYEDSTAQATDASVAMQIYRMPIGSATPVLVAGMNSNGSAATGPNSIASPFINHVFDFQANTYWARIVLRRAATTQRVVAHSVAIEGLPF